MDDMTSKLSEILSDPESMEKIKSMADALGITNQNTNTEKEVKPKAENDLLSKIMPMISAYSNADNDKNVRLLYALKPYLHGSRAEHIDNVALILKVLSVIGEGNDDGK